MHFTRNNDVNRLTGTLFSNPKSRDLVSHNPGISGLKNGPGSRNFPARIPGLQSLSVNTTGVRTGTVVRPKDLYNRL